MPDGTLPPLPAVVCEVPVALDVRPADRTVGEGTPASCTEAALRAAITAGGKIGFACGAAAITIMFTMTLDIGADVVIDGGGLVTLSGRRCGAGVCHGHRKFQSNLANISGCNA